ADVEGHRLSYFPMAELARLAANISLDPEVIPDEGDQLPTVLAPTGYRLLPFDGGLYLYQPGTRYPERGNRVVTLWHEGPPRLLFAPDSVPLAAVRAVLTDLPPNVLGTLVLA